MPPKWFTPESAQSALKEVRPAAETMCALFRTLESRRRHPPSCDERVEPDYFRLVVHLHRVLAALKQAGVRVRDPRSGAVEFPARRAGRPVALSWHVGERALSFWREPGSDPRHPLDEGPWEEAEGAGEEDSRTCG